MGEKRIPSNEVELIYESLVTRYKNGGFLSPESALNHDIQSLMDKEGKTEEEIILRLFRLMDIEGKTREEAILNFHQEPELAKEKAVNNIATKSHIVKLKEKIDTLTFSFSKGEISQETYIRAVKMIEEEISRLREERKIPIVERQQWHMPKTDFRTTSYETREVGEETHQYSSPSALWWLVPFFFGIIGGIVAYVGVKDDDYDMATELLIFGIIWTIILFIVGWILIFR